MKQKKKRQKIKNDPKSEKTKNQKYQTKNTQNKIHTKIKNEPKPKMPKNQK